MDVCLVSMPYTLLNQPSLALSLLKPALEGAGIRAVSFYPCLEFAAEIGLDTYSLLFEAKQEFLVGEWTFAGAAFPELRTDPAAYLDAVFAAPVSRGLQRRSGFRSDPREALWRVRESVPRFVASVARRVLARRPRIVGCTSTFTQHCSSLALLRKVRELDPGVVTVLGGANCEGEMGVAARRCFPWLDFVVSGEGDLVFPELCRKILAQGRDLTAGDLPYGVLGAPHVISALGAPGESSATAGSGAGGATGGLAGVSGHSAGAAAPRASVYKLDSTPVPDFDDYFEALRVSPLAAYIHPALPVETSRGCWWGKKHHCTFCGLNGGNMDFRSKSPDRVVAELDGLSQRYGLRKFNVVDNILDMAYVSNLLPRLTPPARQEPYVLFFETKANLRRDQLERIAASGIRRLQPGIESMHDEILRLVEKGTTALQNVQLLKWARELGVFIAWNFLWDVPGEKDEWYAEMNEWLPLVSHLQPPGMDRIMYHRFSPYHFRAESFGLSLTPYPLYSHIYPVAGEDLRDLAYYFHDERRLTASEELSRRPHLRSVVATVAGWRALWGQDGHRRRGPGGEVPVLLMEEGREPATIRIRDTRPCALAPFHVLADLALEAYLACGRLQTLDSLLGEIEKRGARLSGEPRPEVEAVVEDLVARRLLLRCNGKLLALALSEVRRFPDAPDELPVGYIDFDGWRRGQAQAPRPAAAQ